MPKSKFIQHDTIKSLKKMQKNHSYADIRDRIRAVIMVAKKRTYQEVSDTLGFSTQWVKKLVSDYSGNGIEGLLQLPRKGSDGFLNPNQIIELYSIILSGPPEGSLLSRYRISDLIDLVEKKWGIKYSVGGMHGLLKRMKLSHITTRPQNPKNDPEIMELWKKKLKSSSTIKRKNIRASKSGSRTKLGLVKKG